MSLKGIVALRLQAILRLIGIAMGAKISRVIPFTEPLDSEQLFRAAFDAGAIPMSLTAPDGRLLRVNEAFCRMMGYTQDEILGMPFYNFTHPEDLSNNRAKVQGLLSGAASSFHMEKRYIRKDGAVVWGDVSMSLVRDMEGRPLHMVTHVQDITERKKIEDVFRFLGQCGVSGANGNFFNELARYLAKALAMDFVCVDVLEPGDLAARTLAMFQDGGFADNVSYTLKDTPCGAVVGNNICCFPRRVQDLFPKDNVLRDLQAEGYAGTTLWSAQGNPIGLIALIRRQPLEDTRLIESILQVVAVRAAGELERQQSEATLRASEGRYRLLAETMLQGVVHQDVDGNIIAVNPAAERILGKNREHLLGSSSNKKELYTIRENGERFPPDEHPAMLALKSGQQVHGVVMGVFNSNDNDYRWIRIDAVPQFSSGGGCPSEVYTVFEDITEQKMREKKLTESEQRFKVLAEAMPQMVWTANASGFLDYYNLQVHEYRGGQLYESNAWDLSSLIHPEDLKRTLGAWRRSLKTGKVYVSEQRLRRADGQYRWHLTRGVPIRDNRGRVIRWIGTATDIHDHKKAEEILKRDKDTMETLVLERTKELIAAQMELERTRRLTDIGTLAATVAHELRNPLAAIGIAAYNIKRKAQNADWDKHFDNIEKKITESEQIIKNLLFYSRLKPPHYERVVVGNLLEEIAEELRERTKKKVSFVQTIDAVRGVVIEADPIQIKEVVNNLLNNALDAICLGDGLIQLQGTVDGDFIRIVVSDNGAGIDDKEQERVFDPFFTTKAKGTGLGLSVCRQLVRMHDGTIDLRSGRGQGTTVLVRLPRTARRALRA